MNFQGMRWKPAVKNALTYGLALEVFAIGSGYYAYREYKTNKDFRDKINEQFPELADWYSAVSGVYLKAMPQQLKEKILEKEDITPESKVEPATQKSPK